MTFRRSRVVATLALVSFVATLLLPLVDVRHLRGADPDTGWGGQRIGSGHPVTQVEPVYPAITTDHCALCHWARAFSSSVAGSAVRVVPSVAIGAIVLSAFDTASDVVFVSASPRGPPANL